MTIYLCMSRVIGSGVRGLKRVDVCLAKNAVFSKKRVFRAEKHTETRFCGHERRYLYSETYTILGGVFVTI